MVAATICSSSRSLTQWQRSACVAGMGKLALPLCCSRLSLTIEKKDGTSFNWSDYALMGSIPVLVAVFALSLVWLINEI